jgi:hypothetical protein
MNEKRLKARKIFLEFQNDKDKSKALNVTTMTKKKVVVMRVVSYLSIVSLVVKDKKFITLIIL